MAPWPQRIARWMLCGGIALIPAVSSGELYITTVAGGGSDRVPASQASLGNWTPTVTLDRQGNIYVPVMRLGAVGACPVGTVLGGLPGQSLTHIERVDPAGRLTIVAGNGRDEDKGDGGPALAASFYFARGLAVDAEGSLYTAGYNRIRRVDAATGIVSPFAGTGVTGFGGDGGPAILAGFESIGDLHFNPAGDLYVSDGYRVRRIDAQTGIIETVAGNGLEGYSPDGTPATEASLKGPYSFAVDGAGSLYIGEGSFLGDTRVRFVSPTGILSTVAGNGTYGFSGDGGKATEASLTIPYGLAVDSHGNLFIADQSNARIRRVDGGTGNISSFVLPCSPEEVAVDAQDNLIVAMCNRIYQVDVSTGAVTHLAGVSGSAGDGGPAIGAVFNGPNAVAMDPAGNLFVSDAAGNRIRRVLAATGIIEVVAGGGTGGDGSPALSARVRFATAVAVDATGNLFISETGGDIGCGVSHRVRRVDATTGIITTYAGNGVGDFSGDGGPATSASLYGPMGMAFDSAGNLFIADSANGRVRRVEAATGIITTVAGGGAGGDGAPATDAHLSAPFAVAFDPADNLFIAEPGAHRVRRVDAATGIITTVAGSGVAGYGGDGGPAVMARLNLPFSVAVDASGHLFIADRNNDRIRQVDLATGIITSLVGDAGPGFGGDTGPASAAQIDAPHALALGPDGSLYVADNQNNRVRRLSTHPPGAGSVPCEGWTPENPLTVEMPSGVLDLSWGPSCLRTDQDYTVYEGSLGIWSSHMPVQCTTGGSRAISLTPSFSDAYYLVVPRNLSREGSYGRTSDGVERPPSASACLPQELAGSL
ncbi:MAG: hypothetical protein ACREAA_16455 [Candidatus Polarisedimenticolia bacterium]